MKPGINAEKIIYALTIALILVVLALIVCSPPYFMAGKVVYQGF